MQSFLMHEAAHSALTIFCLHRPEKNTFGADTLTKITLGKVSGIKKISAPQAH